MAQQCETLGGIQPNADMPSDANLARERAIRCVTALPVMVSRKYALTEERANSSGKCFGSSRRSASLVQAQYA
jgi:hypothetical protein